MRAAANCAAIRAHLKVIAFLGKIHSKNPGLCVGLCMDVWVFSAVHWNHFTSYLKALDYSHSLLRISGIEDGRVGPHCENAKPFAQRIAFHVTIAGTRSVSRLPLLVHPLALSRSQWCCHQVFACCHLRRLLQLSNERMKCGSLQNLHCHYIVGYKFLRSSPKMWKVFCMVAFGNVILGIAYCLLCCLFHCLLA